MAKREKIAAPENTTLGLEQQQAARVIALQINDPLMVDLEMLNKAKEDWEGGAFTVMHRVLSLMPEEQIKALPDPKSDTGNNPAHYLVPVTRISTKGKRSEDWKQRYFYSDLALGLPGIVAKQKFKDQLERSLGGEKVNKSDIPANIMEMTQSYRDGLAKKLGRQINGAISNVTKAFELCFQLKAFNERLAHVEAVPSYDLGPDGLPLDGDEGRPMQVVSNGVPIVIKSTVKGREDIDKKAVSISTFLKYDVAKASEENGGTYQSVMNTVKREQPEEQSGHVSGTGNAQDQSRPQAINTADTAIARIVDVAEFMTRAMEAKTKTDWDKIHAELHGPGSDPFFLSARDLLYALTMQVGSPADIKRDSEIRSAEEDAA